jgi:hypothetical protein
MNMDKTEIAARLEFRRAALAKLRAAYLALIDGGVKSYTIDDRTLTRFDAAQLKAEIAALEKEIDELASAQSGGARRRAFGIVPRDW